MNFFAYVIFIKDICSSEFSGVIIVFPIMVLDANIEHWVGNFLQNGIYPTGSDEKDYEIFCHLVARNDLDTLQILVDETPDVDFSNVGFSCDVICFTPLQVAVLSNFTAIVDLLLSKGADPNRQGLLKKDPYESIIPISFRYSVSSFRRTQKVVGDEHEPAAVFHRCGDGITPLHIACHSYAKHKNLELIESLLKNEANVQLVDDFRRTPIFFTQHLEVVDLLLDYGADINHQDMYGLTILHVAVKDKRNDRVDELLKRGMKPEIRSDNGRSAYHFAASGRNLEALKLMLKLHPIDLSNHVDSDGNTPLHLVKFNAKMSCTENCNVSEILFTLMAYGADFKVKNLDGETPRYDSWTSHKCLFYRKMFYLMNDQLCENAEDEEELMTDYQLCEVTKDEEVLMGCKKELEEMKTIALSTYPKVFLYDLMFFDIEKMTKFASNENLLKLFKECEENFQNRFPHYGLILNYKLMRGASRKKLVEEVNEKLELILADCLPQHCSKKIFEYFNDCELREFRDQEWNSILTKKKGLWAKYQKEFEKFKNSPWNVIRRAFL